MRDYPQCGVPHNQGSPFAGTWWNRRESNPLGPVCCSVAVCPGFCRPSPHPRSRGILRVAPGASRVPSRGTGASTGRHAIPIYASGGSPQDYDSMPK